LIRTAALLSAWAILAPQDGPAAPGLAKLVTADADLVLLAPNVPGLLKKLEAPPYRRLLENETLREAIAGAFGARSFDALKLLVLVRDEAMLVFPRIDDPGWIALFDTGLPIHPYAAVLARLFGDDWKREEEKIEGVRAVRMTGPGSNLLYIVGVRRHLVISKGREGLPDLLRRIANPKLGGSLAEAERFRRCVAAVGRSDLFAWLNWSRIRGRSSLLKLLPPGTAGAGIGFGPDALRWVLHLREEKRCELRDWFGEPGRFRPPPGTFEDADSLLWIRPDWNRIWERLETFTDDTEIRFAWERLKAASGIDLKKDLVDTLGPEAALVERADREGALLAWSSLRKPIQARRSARSIYASMRGELRFFAEAPEERGHGDERIYTIEKAGFAATGRGLYLGSFEAIRGALDSNGSPDHALLAAARERLPEEALAIHVRSGRGWRRRLEDPMYWRALVPAPAFARPKRPPFADLWRERMKGLSPVVEGLAASAGWLELAEDGLRGEVLFFWKPE
jgi:hypothetical protein